jgi:parallel beta-helix repeat protein
MQHGGIKMRISAILLMGLMSAVFLTASPVGADTYRVPQDFADMRKALDTAAYGDTVLVSPGKYRVQARVRSGVVVVSNQGADSTVLWNNRWHILELDDCDMATLVSGFTFEGKGCNVCFACSTGAPVIEGNVIKQSWDGINLYKCNALIRDNTILGCNRGIHMDTSDPEVVGNLIRNDGDGISMISSAPVIARCTFQKNGRALLILGHSYPTIGGSLSSANDFLSNGYTVYNAGLRIEGTMYTDQREVAVASYNYWGSLCPDRKKMRGEVVIRPWTDAKHEATYEECPQEGAAEGGGSR